MRSGAIEFLEQMEMADGLAMGAEGIGRGTGMG